MLEVTVGKPVQSRAAVKEVPEGEPVEVQMTLKEVPDAHLLFTVGLVIVITA